MLVAALSGAPALAQVTTRYTNTTDSATNGINESAASCASPFVRTFSVGTSYSISEVEIGILMAHTYRGDLVMDLVSPAGTSVRLTSGTGNGADNFNVRFDQNAASGIANHTSNDVATASTVVPPFEETFVPQNSLGAFNGQDSQGTWQLRICDQFGGDSGTFFQADLFLTSAPTNYADLSLTKSVSNATPTSGSTISYTLTVSNASASPQTATGVVVTDLLPAGITYLSHSGTGTYNSTTGNWTISSLAPGASASLTIQASVAATPGATITNTAEITASSVSDLDSTPNNGVTTEDDYASAAITVAGSRVAGTPPVLSCPAGMNVFDWDTRSWTAGSLTNTYAVTNFGSVQFALSTDGVWVDDPGFGGLSPTLSTANTGGLAGGQVSLHQYLDFANQSQTATTVITLPNGIAGAQFIVFDIDYAANDFADKLTVTGSYNGATVLPTLTNGVVNYVIGNVAIGDGGSGGTSGDGNVVVTFSQAIDTITIVYGNHTTAPAVPDGQAIAIHDITMCAPDTDLSVTKTSAVFSDPVNSTTNPKAIPGALIEYSIYVSNTGISATDSGSVLIVDSVPADAKMCVADIGGAGPVLFTDGPTSSALTYSYVDLGNAGDSLAFSTDDGATWSYVPTADPDGCDSAITNFRVTPTGAFAPGGSFTLRARFIVE